MVTIGIGVRLSRGRSAVAVSEPATVPVAAVPMGLPQTRFDPRCAPVVSGTPDMAQVHGVDWYSFRAGNTAGIGVLPATAIEVFPPQPDGSVELVVAVQQVFPVETTEMVTLIAPARTVFPGVVQGAVVAVIAVGPVARAIPNPNAPILVCGVTEAPR